MGTVKTRKCLHRLDVRQHLVHIHSVQERLVIARLELVGHHKKAVLILAEFLLNARAGKTVDAILRGLGVDPVFPFAGKGHNGLVGALASLQMPVDGRVVFQRPVDTACHHHCAGFAAYLALARHLGVEMFHHDFSLAADGHTVAFYKMAQFFLGFLFVEQRIIGDGFGQLVIALDSRVILQHVHDEAFLRGLLHAVDVEGPMLGFAIFSIRHAEHFQRFVLGRGGKGEIAGVGEHFSCFNELVDHIFHAHVRIGRVLTGKGNVHLGRQAAALAGVRLVNDDGKGCVLMVVADFIQNVRKFVYGGDDDFFAAGNGLAQVAGMLRPLHGVAHLHELLDGVAYLLVQIHTIRHHNDGIHHGLAVFLQPHQLVRQPGNGVGFAAARRMLDEVFVPDAFLLHIGKKRTHHHKLMKARKNLLMTDFFGVFVNFGNNLRVVFDDVGKRLLLQNVFPQIGRLEAVRVDGIARAVVMSFVKGQKP